MKLFLWLFTALACKHVQAHKLPTEEHAGEGMGSALMPSMRDILQSGGTSDVDVLNFALNLEYLEANFYSCAAYGRPIDSSLWGSGGKEPQGCNQANLTPATMEYAKAIAMDEIAHVRVLRSALGAKAVDQPALDLGTAFEAAANAAVGSTLTPSFSPYANDASFYLAAFIFEDVGVTAYKGAAPLISDANTLEVAAGILAVEGYHGGVVRAKLLKSSSKVLFPYGSSVADLVSAISNLRASASGADDDKGLFAAESRRSLQQSGGGFVLAPADKNGVAFSRSPAQVLAIAQLGSELQGGFFPEGTEGGLSPKASPPPPPPSSSSANRADLWGLAAVCLLTGFLSRAL